MTIANGDPTFIVATKQLGFYAQDDWKVTRRLTLSLGLRWDKDYNMIGGSDIKDSRTYLDLVALNSPVSNPYVSRSPKDDNLDFSPRVGFAYDLSGKGNHVLARRIRTVLRQRVPEHSAVHGADVQPDRIPDCAEPFGTGRSMFREPGKTLGQWQLWDRSDANDSSSLDRTAHRAALDA